MGQNLGMIEVDSPLGPLCVAASDSGVIAVDFGKPGLTSNEPPASGRADAIEQQAAKELTEYFAGHRRTFEVPVDLRGTSFQGQVWAVLQSLEFGETITYAEQARRLGKPKATRAVGSANGKNPVPIIVPCHRVVASGGGLGGYAGGLDRKQALLRMESSP